MTDLPNSREGLLLELKYLQNEIDYRNLLIVNNLPGKVCAALMKHTMFSPVAEVTQYQLAAEIGASREPVNRVVRELGAEGIVKTGKRKIHVLDRDALAQKLDDRMDWFLGYPPEATTSLMDSVIRAIDYLSDSQQALEAA